jgi:hypothetical protein
MPVFHSTLSLVIIIVPLANTALRRLLRLAASYCKVFRSRLDNKSTNYRCNFTRDGLPQPMHHLPHSELASEYTSLHISTQHNFKVSAHVPLQQPSLNQLQLQASSPFQPCRLRGYTSQTQNSRSPNNDAARSHGSTSHTLGKSFHVHRLNRISNRLPELG